MRKKRVIRKKMLMVVIGIILLITLISIGVLTIINKKSNNKVLETPYRITLDINGKTTVVETDEYGRIEEPETPKRERYVFLGWYMGDEKVDFSQPFTKNTTIRAKWEKR